MRFSQKHKFVLISNWKCGCSTMANLFLPYSDFGYHDQRKCQQLLGLPYSKMVHWPAYKIKTRFDKNGWNWDKYIKIITVRNPWARIVSLFFYKYGNMKKKSRQQIKVKFTEFVKKELPQWKSGIRNRWTTEQMINDPRTGKKLVNYVVRIEHLQEDLEPIIKKHFSKFEPLNYNMKRNTTAHEHYSYYYTKETRKIVAQMFNYDIRKYKYKFEKPKQEIQEETIQPEIKET